MPRLVGEEMAFSSCEVVDRKIADSLQVSRRPGAPIHKQEVTTVRSQGQRLRTARSIQPHLACRDVLLCHRLSCPLQCCQARLCTRDEIVLIGKLTHHPAVRPLGLRASQLLVALPQLDQCLRGECPIRGELTRDPLIDLDRTPQVSVGPLLYQCLLEQVVAGLGDHRYRCKKERSAYDCAKSAFHECLRAVGVGYADNMRCARMPSVIGIPAPRPPSATFLSPHVSRMSQNRHVPLPIPLTARTCSPRHAP